MNLFEWLPKSGEFRKLPDGTVIWCQEWITRQNPHSQIIEGEITFKFYITESDYVRYTGKQQGELDPRLTS